MLMAQNVIIRVLESLEVEMSIDKTYRLSKSFLDAKAIRERYLKTLNLDNYIFVISFSNNKDTLPMWSMYSKDGKGVCLCLNEEILSKYFEDNDDLQTKIVSVSYDLTNLNETTRKELCRLYQLYIKEMEDEEIPDKENLKHFYQYHFIRVLAPIYKDSTYNYEGEKRLICTQQQNVESIDFRVSANGFIIPYRRINIPVNALKEIIIGPSYNYELFSKGLKMELILSGVQANIIKSKVYYRTL